MHIDFTAKYETNMNKKFPFHCKMQSNFADTFNEFDVQTQFIDFRSHSGIISEMTD